MRTSNRSYFFFIFLFLVAGNLFISSLLATPLKKEKDSDSSSIHFDKNADETCYIDLHYLAYEVIKKKIIGEPPAINSELQKKDEHNRETIVKNATDVEKLSAIETIDNVFSFSRILGDQFNAKNLPLTAAFFETVDRDTSLAVDAAKKTFRRPRPLKSNGWSYPSGHSTRAFSREVLLSIIFPNCKEALYNQARQFAQNRVILGRHYPRDIAAGEIYGTYIVAQYLKDVTFQQDWEAVVQEITALIPSTTLPLIVPLVEPPIAALHPPIVRVNNYSH